MNKTWTRGLVLLGALLVLGALNFAILGKERIRRDGEVVYLPLVPVDPRSLMQGDYMALRFQLVRELEDRAGDSGADGRDGETLFAPVVLDGQRVAHLAPAGVTPPLRLRYRYRAGRIWLGTNAFFFEEGSADRYNGARYGEFRVDPVTGEAVLVGLRNAGLQAM